MNPYKVTLVTTPKIHITINNIAIVHNIGRSPVSPYGA